LRLKFLVGVAGLLFLLILNGCALTAPAPPAPPVLNYENPVFPEDFPDPFILRVGETYYAYSTNAGSANIQVIRSTDLLHWERTGERGDALPKLPAWAAAGQFLTWAPSVLQRDQEFILYYVTRYVEGGRQCISYAVSPEPDGPFVDPNEQPFLCQLAEGGSIDPDPFIDQNGQLYLLWKNDGNCCGLPIWLYSQALAADGRSLAGEPHRLLTQDQNWEKPLIENPTMAFHQGRYYLLYSANWWESEDYAVGYGVCESPTGPCQKPHNGPVLASAGPTVRGPGGASFFRDAEDGLWLAYHAWASPTIGYPSGKRRLHLARVAFIEGAPVFYRPEGQE
jgi:beta-xylosidase